MVFLLLLPLLGTSLADYFRSSNALECNNEYCEQIDVKCLEEDDIANGVACIGAVDEFDPLDPCDPEDFSTCPICPSGYRCLNHQCVQRTQQLDELCCDEGSQCRDNETTSMKFCVNGLNCEDSVCSLSQATNLTYLQFGEECDYDARPNERCYGNLLGCHPTEGRCRYWDRVICSTESTCNDTANWRDDLLNGDSCSSDGDCKWGEYCALGSSGVVACQPINAAQPIEERDCSKSFISPSSTNLWTMNCGHSKICRRENPLDDQEATKFPASCQEPFQGGSGTQCISGDDGAYLCDKGQRCKCAGSLCMCDSEATKECEDAYGCTENGRLGCKAAGLSTGEGLQCYPSDDGFALESYMAWKWDNGDKAYRQCLQENECQLFATNSKCALENGCVDKLANRYTANWAEFESRSYNRQLNSGPKYECRKKANPQGAGAANIRPTVWLLAVLAIFAYQH